MSNDLLYTVKDGIAYLTFNRPDFRNALTFEMYDALSDIASDLTKDHQGIHAMILSGAGDKAFAAGTDISRFRDFSSAEDALGYERKMDLVLGTLERVPIPTIAAIQGACTGGGAAIACCCDLRITAPDLKFGIPIARTLGNCLSVGNLARLNSLLGAGRAKEILFTSRLILADEALQVGLVSEITDNVMQRAVELAEQMKSHAPLTLKATKEGMLRLREQLTEIDDDDLIISCYTSEDFHEGLDAFLAKRKPQWQGR